LPIKIAIRKSNDTITVATFEYDALGRRIEKVDAIAGTTTRFYYDDQRVLLESVDTGSGFADAGYYIWGNYIDEALVMNRNSDDYYYGHDHLYSPVALFESDGDLVERYEYDAYGKATITGVGADGLWFTADDVIRTVSLYSNAYTFTGRELDTLDAGGCKLMYYRARYYDTQTGRFLQRDPLGINPAGGTLNPFAILKQYTDGMNLHEYVRSNVISHTDPFGLYGRHDEPWPGLPILPPSLKKAGGNWECCSNVEKGIDIANKALQSEKCKNWFKDWRAPKRRWSYGGVFKVRVRGNRKVMCALGAYFYTWPITSSIAACKRSCDELSPETAALLLIHELAHHYCTIGWGREDCANSAMEACGG